MQHPWFAVRARRAAAVAGPVGFSRRIFIVVLVWVGVTEAAYYNPNASHTFDSLHENFYVEYLDSAYLKGFVAQDIVGLGEYSVKTRFGCVTTSHGHDFYNADGILGLGLPATALPAVPNPLMFTLSDQSRRHLPFTHIMPNRAFALLMSSEEGELQLGGFDPAAIKGHLISTPVLPEKSDSGVSEFKHYKIGVDGLRLGDVDLISFQNPQNSGVMEAILDSGTSCMVIPDTDFDGLLKESPWKRFEDSWHMVERKPLYIKINGHEFALPYEDYVINGRPCLMRMPTSKATFLLGDVFFRQMVVIHDLTNMKAPSILLGERDPDYELGVRGQLPKSSDTPGHKLAGAHQKIPLSKQSNKAHPLSLPNVDSVHLETLNGFIYYAYITVGIPKQKQISVILDTGSSVFAIFSGPVAWRIDIFTVIMWSLMAVIAVLAFMLMRMSWKSREYTRIPSGVQHAVDDDME